LKNDRQVSGDRLELKFGLTRPEAARRCQIQIAAIRTARMRLAEQGKFAAVTCQSISPGRSGTDSHYPLRMSRA
jgi:hypothetical protein